MAEVHDLDWRGGDVSVGSWNGRPFESPFIPVGSNRPARGLVSFYLDLGPSGNFGRKNTTQRMGMTTNVLWTFFPTAIAVIYGILWMVFDGEVKNREIYRQLSQPQGCKGAGSLCLDYHCFWTPFSVIQAIRYQQWPVASSSIGSTLALIAIPNIQNYAFKWVVFSGGYFDWGAQYTWQSGQLDPYWAEILLGMLALSLTCSLCPFLSMRPYGFTVPEPGGIMTVAELVWNRTPAYFGLDESHETASFNDIASILWDQRFRLVEENNLTRLSKLPGPTSPVQPPVSASTTPSLQARNHRFRSRCKSLRSYWSSFLQTTKRHIREVLIWTNGSPCPFLLRPLPLALWILFLSLVLAANAHIVHNMTSPQQLFDQNYAIPWKPSLYIVVGVFIQVRLLISPATSLLSETPLLQF